MPLANFKDLRIDVVDTAALPDLDALVSSGAQVLRHPDAEIGWHVLADPEATSSAPSFPEHR